MEPTATSPVPLKPKGPKPEKDEWMRDPFPQAAEGSAPPPKPELVVPKPRPQTFFGSVLETFDVSKWIERPRPYYPNISTLPSSHPDAPRALGPGEYSKPRRWDELTEEERDNIRRLLGKASWRNSPTGHALGGLAGGAALGFIGSTLQNAIQRHDAGWKGVFTRTGGTIWTFALAGGVYGFVDAYGQKARKTDDALGKFTAGCAAGFIVGMQGKSLPLAIGSCVFLGTPVAVLQAQGGSLRGDGQFEYASQAGQQAERYSSLFRPPPMTREERVRLEKAMGMSIEEIQKKEKVMSPALKKALEDRTVCEIG